MSLGSTVFFSTRLTKGKRLLGDILQLLFNKPAVVRTASKSSPFMQLLPTFSVKFYNPAFLSLKSWLLAWLAVQTQNNAESWRGLALYQNWSGFAKMRGSVCVSFCYRRRSKQGFRESLIAVGSYWGMALQERLREYLLEALRNLESCSARSIKRLYISCSHAKKKKKKVRKGSCFRPNKLFYSSQSLKIAKQVR